MFFAISSYDRCLQYHLEFCSSRFLQSCCCGLQLNSFRLCFIERFSESSGFGPRFSPSLFHSSSDSDDYAAKIAEIGFWAEASSKHKNSGEGESEHSELPPISDPETNVYGFGVLLLELISGKLPYSNEQGPIVNWAAEYLNDRQKFGNMIDPMLKSFKNNELDIICEVIQDCIQRDMRKRPTMKEVTSKRREVMLYHPMQQLQDSLPSGGPNLRSYPWRQLKIRFEIFFIPCLSLTYSKENCLKMQFKP